MSTTEANYYEDFACEIFKSAFEKDCERSKELLIHGNKYFDGRTILELAIESKSKHFMALDGVQQKLDNIWHNTNKESVRIGENESFVKKVKFHFTGFLELFTYMALISPRYVRIYSLLSHFVFIFMFMYIIVFDFCNYISMLQWFHFIWMITLTIDEGFQIATERRRYWHRYNVLDLFSCLVYLIAFC